MQESITAGITFKCVADAVSAPPFMCMHHHNDSPIQFNILTIRLAGIYRETRPILHAATVRLAISLATNKKNKSPVTVPDNRCSISEPLDEHQLCTIISHIHKVRCLAYMPGFFCQITALSQQAASHYSMRGKVMCPNT